jgi:hypothetical protein
MESLYYLVFAWANNLLMAISLAQSYEISIVNSVQSIGYFFTNFATKIIDNEKSF